MQDSMASNATQTLNGASKIAAKLSRSAEARSGLNNDGTNGYANEIQSPSRRQKRKESKSIICNNDDNDVNHDDNVNDDGDVDDNVYVDNDDNVDDNFTST